MRLQAILALVALIALACRPALASPAGQQEEIEAAGAVSEPAAHEEAEPGDEHVEAAAADPAHQEAEHEAGVEPGDEHEAVHEQAEHHEGPAAVLGHGEPGHEEGHDEHGGHGHDISQVKWLPSTAEDDERHYPAYLWMVINFLVLLAILYYAGRKTVARFLKERRDRLMASIDEASHLKQEAQERHRDYSGRLSKIEHEEERIRDELVTAAVKDKDRLMADAGARAEKMRSEAKVLVDRERAEAELRLRRETAGRAVEVAREILVKRIGPGEHKRLVDDYMKLIESQVKS